MTVSKNYPRWIKGLTKEQFDELVKVFVHVKFNVEMSAIVDGKGDGGIDIKIFENERAKKIPIQITVEQNVYAKLEKDLAKISKLIDNEGYLPNFYFFYSGGASETKESELKQIASDNFDVNLEIIDADVIGAYIQTPKYYLVREKLKFLLGEIFTENETYFDDYDKMKFDLISYGTDSIALKSRFVESYILHSLLKSEGYKKTISSLCSEIKDRFGKNIDIDFCERQCQYLKNKDKLTFEGPTSNQVKLTETTADSLKLLVDEISLQEKEYVSEIEKIIRNYLINVPLEDVIKKVFEVLKASYIKDKKEIVRDPSYVNGEDKALISLKNYFKSHIERSEDVEIVATKISELSHSNDFLQKICAGDLFKSLINSEEFEAYQRRSSKSIIIDTPVLIYLLCAFYDRTFDYENQRYKVATHLVKLIRSKDSNLQFLTSTNYVKEATNHIISAINLIPSINLGLFDLLGGSTNTFYQFYSSMKSTGYIDLPFEDFFEDFGIPVKDINETHLQKYIDEYLVNLLNDNWIKTVNLHEYNDDTDYSEEFDEIQKDLESIYNMKGLSRSNFASKNDALMLTYIYDEHLSENELVLIDPTVITWDGTFSEFRRKHHAKHPRKRYWHLFRPSKFLDHHSLLNFKINSEAISLDLLSITQDEFDLKEKINNLNEILNKIVNMRTAEGTKLSTGLAEIRRDYIYGLKGNEVDESAFQELQPIDEVIIKLSKYFTTGQSKHSLATFKNSLTKESFINQFLKLISNEITYFQINKNFTNTINKETDLMIDKILNS